jgi:hypothetical protein
MKTKYLMVGMVALLAAGGLWFGRAAWRAHRQRVTLDVRNAPLADVLRKLERQTWRKLRAEKNLDARITLRVVDKPLANVLDQIAGQAGAHWSTLYAVYDSARALNALDSSLRGDGKLEPAGWTKLAPQPPEAAAADPGDPGFPPPFHPNPDDSGPMAGQRGRQIMVRRGENGATIARTSDGQVEMWSPEELVMESALNGRLGGARRDLATAATAADVARKVKGKLTTYLAFRKSNLGMGFGHLPNGRPGLDPARRGPNDHFSRLTPEQRVRRARERIHVEEN